MTFLEQLLATKSLSSILWSPHLWLLISLDAQPKMLQPSQTAAEVCLLKEVRRVQRIQAWLLLQPALVAKVCHNPRPSATDKQFTAIRSCLRLDSIPKHSMHGTDAHIGPSNHPSVGIYIQFLSWSVYGIVILDRC